MKFRFRFWPEWVKPEPDQTMANLDTSHNLQQSQEGPEWRFPLTMDDTHAKGVAGRNSIQRAMES